MKKKFIKGMACIFAASLLTAFPSVGSKASGGGSQITMEGNENQIGIQITDSQAEENQVTSLQMSFTITAGENQDSISPEFIFDPSVTSEIQTFRYHPETGRMNIYVAGTEEILKKAGTDLGNIKINTEETEKITVKVEFVSDSFVTVDEGNNKKKETNIKADSEEIIINDSSEAKPDKEALEALIKKAESVDRKLFKPESMTEFDNTLKKAKEVLKATDSSQAEIEEAENMLKISYDALMTRLDTKELENLAESIKNIDRSVYEKESLDVLDEKMQYAEQVIAKGQDKKASEIEIESAFKELKEAYENLKVISNADSEELWEMIQRAEKMDTTPYTKKSVEHLNQVIQSAKKIAEDAQSDAEDFKKAVEDLNDAIMSLEEKASKEEIEELQKLLNESEKLQKADYTATSWKTFSDSKKAAEELLKSDDIGKEEYQEIKENFVLGMEGLIKGATAEQKEQFLKVLQKIEGLQQDNYTKESWDILVKAKEEAENSSKNPDLTMAEMEGLIEKLQNAVNSLEKKEPVKPEKVDKTKLQMLLEQSYHKNKEEYTQESWNTFVAARSYAETVMKNEDAKQKEVDQAAKELEAAMNTLKLKEENNQDESTGEIEKPETPEAPQNSQNQQSEQKNDAKKTEPVSDSSEQEQVETGDQAPVTAVFIILIVAAGVVVVVLRRKMKK